MAVKTIDELRNLIEEYVIKEGDEVELRVQEQKPSKEVVTTVKIVGFYSGLTRDSVCVARNLGLSDNGVRMLTDCREYKGVGDIIPLCLENTDKLKQKREEIKEYLKPK